MARIATSLSKLPRLSGWLLITLLLLAAVLMLAPQQLPVSLYKLSLVTLAAVVGYWLDRSLFPYGRPDELQIVGSAHFGVAMLRRALIVSASMIAMGLGA